MLKPLSGETHMYSQSDIEDAIEAGALDREQAARFRSHVAAQRGQPTADEEYFRFILGFNDIFITVTCVLALVGTGWLGSQFPLSVDSFGPSIFTAILPAMAAWGLSELFAVRRRTALASIVLVLALGYGVLISAGMLGAKFLGEGQRDISSGGWIFVIGALLAAAAVWAHWRRFRVPFAHAAFVGFAVLALAMVTMTLFMPDMRDMFGSGRGFEELEAGIDRFRTAMAIVLLLSGIATFAYAMRWDASDPRRETDRSEVGFWLHWLAAGLVVHGLMSILGMSGGAPGAGTAIALLLVYLLFALVSLATSRRALLVLGLIYLVYAMTALLGGGRGSSDAMMAILVVSLLLLVLAFTWPQLRAAVVGMLPEGLQAKLPPIERPQGDDVY